MDSVQKIIYYANNYNLKELVDMIEDFKDKIDSLEYTIGLLEKELSEVLEDKE